MFEWIEEFMETFGVDYETAAREYDATHNPDYDADDYDCEFDCYGRKKG